MKKPKNAPRHFETGIVPPFHRTPSLRFPSLSYPPYPASLSHFLPLKPHPPSHESDRSLRNPPIQNPKQPSYPPSRSATRPPLEHLKFRLNCAENAAASESTSVPTSDRKVLFLCSESRLDVRQESGRYSYGYARVEVMCGNKCLGGKDLASKRILDSYGKLKAQANASSQSQTHQQSHSLKLVYR